MDANDPDLDECWGPIPSPADPKSRKQQLYTNMVIAAWEMAYETGATPEHRLRYNANEMFSGEVGRTFWQNHRENRLSTSANRRERRFHQILDEEYQQVVASLPTSHEASPWAGTVASPGTHPAVPRLIAAALSAVLLAVGWCLSRRVRTRAK